MTQQKCYRQGELLFIKVEVPETFKSSVMEAGKVKQNNVIREGEVTGHIHKASENAELLEFTDQRVSRWSNGRSFWKDGTSFKLPDGQMFLSADNKIVISHDEHNALSLPKGDYVIRIQREYDEEQDRLIAD